MEKCAPLSSTLYQLWLFDSGISRVKSFLTDLNYFRRQLYHCCSPGRVDVYDDLPTALFAWPLAQYVQRLAHLGDDLLDYVRAVAVCAHHVSS